MVLACAGHNLHSFYRYSTWHKMADLKDFNFLPIIFSIGSIYNTIVCGNTT
jgi:hypothetical protein